MTATRSRKEEKEYMRYHRTLDKGSCVFCGYKGALAESEHFMVIRNIYPYSVWDSHKVADHLLVVPKEHTDTMSGHDEKKVVEMHALLAPYEKEGYNVYSRAPGSTVKSIIHQHTHLIKTEGNAKKVIFMMRRPFYIRIAL